MKLVASLSFSSKFCGLEAHSLNTGVHHSKYTENVTCILYHQSAPKKQHNRGYSCYQSQCLNCHKSERRKFWLEFIKWITLACKNVFCLTLKICVNHDNYVQVLFYFKIPYVTKACKDRTSGHTKFDCLFKLCSPTYKSLSFTGQVWLFF